MGSTPAKEGLKARVCEAIERNANRIIDIGETILHNPETGFREEKTASLTARTPAEATEARRPRERRRQWSARKPGKCHCSASS